MGEVYRADDLKLGQPVALKLMAVDTTRAPEAFARFAGEVRLARGIAHPNVCRVYDIAEAEGWHYLSMEHVDGETLESLLRRIGRLPTAKALDVARQLFAGVAAAHDRGVLHRDLEPSNIMIDGRGRVRIMDFGPQDLDCWRYLDGLLGLTILLRIGLLAYAVTLICERLLTHSPITLQPDSWYFGSSLVILLLVAAIAAYGFIVSLGGHPAFGAKAPS